MSCRHEAHLVFRAVPMAKAQTVLGRRAQDAKLSLCGLERQAHKETPPWLRRTQDQGSAVLTQEQGTRDAWHGQAASQGVMCASPQAPGCFVLPVCIGLLCATLP